MTFQTLKVISSASDYGFLSNSVLLIESQTVFAPGGVSVLINFWHGWKTFYFIFSIGE